MARRTPGNRSITLTTANVEYNLYTLLAAKNSTYSLPKKAQTVAIQVDIGAGAAKVYVGEPGSVAATDCGAVLVATQAWEKHGFTNNLVRLDDIALKGDTNSTQLNISWITR